MADGSGKGSRQVIPYSSSSKTTLPRTGYLGTLSAKPAEQSLAYERTTRVRHEYKQTGSYERYSVKEKASTGEPHVEKGTGKVGVKDEFTQRSTIKIGDKSGYIQYERDERFRNVKYDDGKSPNNHDIDSDSDIGKYDDDDENHAVYHNHHDAVHSVFSYDYDVAPSYDYDDGFSDDDDY
ncbi:uncharacterized protein LOC130780788 [Actinidia eriantha]|uniref:uncharacterized protein LOC130780788 n=1 Tax=Actinidia eriantha TaxID=165200 RepID=UPI00258954B2|nr:uncharacterized protein LOC130780788 [Actinidia eriantha]